MRLDTLTEAARRVLARAAAEAERLGHARVGTGHLLLALARESGTVATTALAEWNHQAVEPLAVDVEACLSEGAAGAAGGRLTLALEQLLAAAAREAQAEGVDWIGTEHFLLAMTGAGPGVGPGVLRAVGRASLRQPLAQHVKAARRPNREAARPADKKSSERERGRLVPPPLVLGELERVIPVGQTRRIGASALTLLSVELCESGFAIQLRYRPPAIEEAATLQFARLQLRIEDDGGRRYQGAGRYGVSLPFARDLYEYRYLLGCWPALDPSARQLRFEITPVRTRPRATEGTSAGAPSALAESEIWQFEVSIPPVPATQPA